jgi:hypothetical protein
VRNSRGWRNDPVRAKLIPDRFDGVTFCHKGCPCWALAQRRHQSATFTPCWPDAAGRAIELRREVERLVDAIARVGVSDALETPLRRTETSSTWCAGWRRIEDKSVAWAR